MSHNADAVSKRRPYAPRMPMPERREQLLDATLRVINRDGYDAVSMEAIAREAKVTKPVVYGAFDDLRTLLNELHDRQQERVLHQLLAALPAQSGVSVEEYVAGTIRAWIESVLADPDSWRPVLLARGGTPAVVWERIDQGREVVRLQLADLLRSIGLGDEGPVDPDVFAHTLVATGYHFGQLLLTDPDRVDVEALVSTIQTLVAAATVARS